MCELAHGERRKLLPCPLELRTDQHNTTPCRHGYLLSCLIHPNFTSTTMNILLLASWTMFCHVSHLPFDGWGFFTTHSVCCKHYYFWCSGLPIYQPSTYYDRRRRWRGWWMSVRLVQWEAQAPAPTYVENVPHVELYHMVLYSLGPCIWNSTLNYLLVGKNRV